MNVNKRYVTLILFPGAATDGGVSLGGRRPAQPAETGFAGFGDVISEVWRRLVWRRRLE